MDRSHSLSHYFVSRPVRLAMFPCISNVCASLRRNLRIYPGVQIGWLSSPSFSSSRSACLSVRPSVYLLVLWNNRHSLSIPRTGRTLRYFFRRSIECSWEIRWKFELKNDSEHAVLNSSFREISVAGTPPSIMPRMFDGHTQQTWIINKTRISWDLSRSARHWRREWEGGRCGRGAPLWNHIQYHSGDE